MRRALLAIFGTIAGLVGLLSFKTHTTAVATARRRSARPTRAPARARPGSAPSATASTGSAAGRSPGPRRRPGHRRSGGGQDRDRRLDRHPMGPGPGQDHRQQRQDHERHRRGLPAEQPARPGDQRHARYPRSSRRASARARRTSTWSPGRRTRARATSSRCRVPWTSCEMTASHRAGAAPRTVHVEHCMGTVFTLDIRDAGPWDDAIDEAVDLAAPRRRRVQHVPARQRHRAHRAGRAAGGRRRSRRRDRARPVRPASRA